MVADKKGNKLFVNRVVMYSGEMYFFFYFTDKIKDIFTVKSKNSSQT